MSRSTDIDAVEVKAGEGVTLRNGESVTLVSTVTLDESGAVVSQEHGNAYVERDGVLEVYPDWADA